MKNTSVFAMWNIFVASLQSLHSCFCFLFCFLYFRGLEACVKILIYSLYVEKEKDFSESSVFKVWAKALPPIDYFNVLPICELKQITYAELTEAGPNIKREIWAAAALAGKRCS